MSVVVPYITSWSTEQDLPITMMARRSGIGYLDETLTDRDEHGVLWTRIASSPGHGRPMFGKVHSLRQRRVMSRLLCQVCGGPADRTEQGVLFLLKDDRWDWPNWPEGMGCSEPPVCLPCARVSIRSCPALRKGCVAVRVGHSTVSGVYGAYYRPAEPQPVMVEDVMLPFEDPGVRWMRATQLVRELHDCKLVNL
jgi:hypothetical protein